jgi:predicted transposase/invertase (TIGR01784 family)
MEEHKKSINEYYDVRSAIQYAEQIGMEKGRMEGVGIGMEKSRQEIAQKCALKGMPVEEIAEMTSLTVGQVIRFLQNPQ